MAPCDWAAPDLSLLTAPYGLVVAADCTWLQELVEPFVSTLEAVTAPGSQVGGWVQRLGLLDLAGDCGGCMPLGVGWRGKVRAPPW